MHIRLPAGMDRAGVAVISVMVCASCTACRLRWHVLAHGTTWVLVFASFRESGKKGFQSLRTGCPKRTSCGVES
jgi:hypothetical protein